MSDDMGPWQAIGWLLFSLLLALICIGCFGGCIGGGIWAFCKIVYKIGSH